MTLAHDDVALACEGLAGVFGEGRLGVESIEVADAAAHEKRDDAFGAGVGLCALCEESSEGEAAVAAERFKEEFSAGTVSLHQFI